MKLSDLREKLLGFKAILDKLLRNKKRIVGIALCIGVILLLLFSELLSRPKTEQTQEPAEELYAQELETKLSDLIASIQDAGKAKVMVTLRSGNENVYARNDKLDSESRPEGERTQSEQEFVLVGSGSGETGLHLRTDTPQVLGVAVVCEGADLPQVRQAITETVTAALGVSASHVSVVRMKSERN